MCEQIAAEERIFRLLHMARRAGKLTAGDRAVREKVRRGKACCVILASDAGSVRNHFESLASRARVPIAFFSDKQGLGKLSGRDFQAVLSIDEAHLAGEVMKHLEPL